MKNAFLKLRILSSDHANSSPGTQRILQSDWRGKQEKAEINLLNLRCVHHCNSPIWSLFSNFPVIPQFQL